MIVTIVKQSPKPHQPAIKAAVQRRMGVSREHFEDLWALASLNSSAAVARAGMQSAIYTEIARMALQVPVGRVAGLALRGAKADFLADVLVEEVTGPIVDHAVRSDPVQKVLDIALARSGQPTAECVNYLIQREAFYRWNEG